MTDRGPDHGFSLAPRPIAPGSSGRARRRRISAIVVLFVAGGLVALASFGPRLGERPSFNPAFFATPQVNGSAGASGSLGPSATPRPVIAGTTPLPAVTRNDLGLITGTLPIIGDGFRLVDLGSGLVVQQIPTRSGQDLVAPAPSGFGWVCICFIDQGGETGIISREVDFVRIAPDGIESSRQRVAMYGGTTTKIPTISIQSDVDLDADGRTGVIATVVQTQVDFTYLVAPVDLVAGSVGPALKIATEAPPPRPAGAASPPPPQAGDPPRYTTSDTYSFGPFARVAPDGRHAFVWVTLQLQGQEGILASERFGWTVDLSAGAPTIGPAAGLTRLPDYCTELAFLDDGRAGAFCRDPPNGDYGSTEPPRWRYLEIDRNGDVTRDGEVLEAGPLQSDVLFDVANDAVWTWSTVDLTLSRVDLATLHPTRVSFDPTAQAAPGVGSFGGATPVWRRPVSFVAGTYGPVIAGAALPGAPGSERLYLIGSMPQSENGPQPGSLGIYVVDPATLGLVGHWAADALYVSVQPWRDGAIIVAAGAPQADASGQEAPWDASLTMHDATDGRILLRLGQLGQGYGATILQR